MEGIDGAGKSTLQTALLRRLRRRGLRVAAWHEPVHPTIGKAAQALATTDPMAAAIEFTVDRWIGRPRLEGLLATHDLVISDRSFYSTLAYQGSALPAASRRAIARLQESATVPPDRIVLLDLPLDRAMQRVGRRGRARAPLERERTLRRVSRSYRRFAREGGWRVLDARAPRKEIAEQAAAWIVSWLRRRPGSTGRGRG